MRENGKPKSGKIAFAVGAVLLLIGIILLVIKALSVEYVDADGILRESFFLLPCGFSCVFCGLIVWLTVGIRAIIVKARRKQR